MDSGVVDKSEVMVSVVTLAYNHANYIRQTLDGFLMQETRFQVEFIVHDDAPTDGTAEILREYEAAHPGIFRAILQTENQFSKKVRNLPRVIKMARGKYVALCEGDDYWTNSRKHRDAGRINGR